MSDHRPLRAGGRRRPTVRTGRSHVSTSVSTGLAAVVAIGCALHLAACPDVAEEVRPVAGATSGQAGGGGVNLNAAGGGGADAQGAGAPSSTVIATTGGPPYCECIYCCAQECCNCPTHCNALESCYDCTNCGASGEGCILGYDAWSSLECAQANAPPFCADFVACIEICRSGSSPDSNCESTCVSSYPAVGCEFAAWLAVAATPMYRVNCAVPCARLASSAMAACELASSTGPAGGGGGSSPNGTGGVSSANAQAATGAGGSAGGG